MHFHFGQSLHVTVLEIHIQFQGSRNRVDGTGRHGQRGGGGASVVHPGETCGLRKLELLVAGGDGALSSNEIKSLFSVLCGRYVVPAFEGAGECADLRIAEKFR